MFWAHVVAGTPIPILVPIMALIYIKALFDVAVSSWIVEMLHRKQGIKSFLQRLK